LVGVGAAQTVTAVGETPNLAARLQALAELNTVVVSDATRLQLGQMFELEDLGLIALKGFDKPVQAWRATRETGAASRSETVYVGALTPLVGRDEELDLLVRRWLLARAGEGRVVLIPGEPGILRNRLGNGNWCSRGDGNLHPVSIERGATAPHSSNAFVAAGHV
jgi:hypothetical protein